MTEPLEVTAEQIAAARLQVVLDERSGRPTPEVVRIIAGMTEGQVLGSRPAAVEQLGERSGQRPPEARVSPVPGRRTAESGTSVPRIRPMSPPEHVRAVASGSRATAAAAVAQPARHPVQRRGAATVTAILDSMAELLQRYDYDDITTARIVEMADIPIGSFYQYFPDKRSVLHALAMRGAEEYLAEFEQGLLQLRWPGTDWRDAAGGIVDLLMEMRGTTQAMIDAPGNGWGRDDPAVDPVTILAERLAELLFPRFAVTFSEDGRLRVRMAVQLLISFVRIADRVPVVERAQLIAMTKRYVLETLAPAFEPEPETDEA